MGRTLLAVERLSWTDADGSVETNVGPIHIDFEEAGALSSAASPTGRSVSAPLKRATNRARLESCESVRNKLGDPVGVSLEFDLGTIALSLAEGEVAT